MGKKDFRKLYRRIKSELGEISCKISYFSDDFDSNKNYAGIIVYAIDGKFRWVNKSGKAKGYNGRSFYIIIRCTDDYDEDKKRNAGQGMVHHYPLEDTLGYEIDKDRVCCGGFAYHKRKLKFSSIWLNQNTQNGINGEDWETDDNKQLSKPEKVLVEYCFEQYKKKGKHSIFKIPDDIDRKILS